MSRSERDSELHMALRQLPRTVQPTRDLWPGIAARIGAGSPAQVRALRRRRLPHLALAASIALLALGVTRWWPQASVDPQAQMMQQQVTAMTREYDAALAQLPQAALPPVLAPGLQALDASAVQIRRALQQAPHSTRLIAQLQHTYALRLRLSQRGMHG
jgi:hypothetical protein